MLYSDRVYGRVKIREPVILELIESPALQRLKGIEQSGYFAPYFPGKVFSRFEHSLGVYLLLNKFAAPLIEQVAGLIHDVSHTTFSHCIDYVLAGGSQKKHDFQDKVFKEYVKKTSIPGILAKYGYPLEYFFNEQNFHLKERELPDLCADRIDYTLRTALVIGVISEEEAAQFLDNLLIEKKHWVFKNYLSAQKFARLFYKLNNLYFASFNCAVMFKTLADLLKHALSKKYLEEGDFFTTDKEVLSKIKKHLAKDKELNLFWQRANNKIRVFNDPKNFETFLYCKSRSVDPLFKDKGEILHLSNYYSEWKKVVREELTPKKYFLRFAK